MSKTRSKSSETNLVCRTCMASARSSSCVNLMSTKRDKSPLHEIYADVLGIRIEENDQKPSQVCEACFKLIIELYRFRQKAATSERLWNERLTKKTVQEVPDSTPQPNRANHRLKKEGTIQWLGVTAIIPDTARRIDNGRIGCPNCVLDYKKSTSLLDHIEEVHSGKNSFLCFHCSLEFSTFREMKRHVLREHIERNYECFHCSKKFFNFFMLKAHINRIHNPSFQPTPVKQLPCPQCERSFKTRRHLNRHLAVKHGSGLPKIFKCTFSACDKAFSDYTNLQKHKQVHERTFPCQNCEAVFIEAKELRRHQSRDHPVRIEYICELCAATLGSRSALKLHLRRHQGLTYKCTQCDSCYKSAGGLKLHEASHDENSHFPCRVCAKVFYTAKNVRRHFRHNHTEEGRENLNMPVLECPHCSMRISGHYNLQKHIEKQHEGVKRYYECSFCKKVYESGGNVRRHLRQFHAEKLIHPTTSQNLRRFFREYD